MIFLKEVILNQLIKIDLVKKIAQDHHSTGADGNEIEVNKIYDLYFSKIDPFDKRVLELGPGQTYQVIEKALRNGASRGVIVDISCYLDDVFLRQKEIEYYIYDGKKIPLESESVDIICSNAVLEHVRYPEITIQETYRLLRKGGVAIHAIDLRDHFFLDPNSPDVFNCLRYSRKAWELMTWNRSNYVNRLRVSDWENLFTNTGFTISLLERRINEAMQKLLINNQQPVYLKSFAPEDVITEQCLVLISK